VYTRSVARPTVRDRSTVPSATERRWLLSTWRREAFVHERIWAFIVKMLRRPRKRRTFESVNPGVTS
jgi:hypothetical protein